MPSSLVEVSPALVALGQNVLDGDIEVLAGTRVARIKGLLSSVLTSMPAGTLFGNLFDTDEPGFPFDANIIAGDGLTYDLDIKNGPFPIVVDQSQQAFPASSLTMDVVLSSNRKKDDKVIIGTQHNGANTVTTPSGWTLLGNIALADSSVNVYERILDGTEPSILTITASIAGATLAKVWVVRYTSNSVHSQVLSQSNTSTGGTSNDIGSLSPTWGIANTLWLTFIGIEADDPSPPNITAFPTGFGDTGELQNVSGTAALDGAIGWGWHTFRSTALDPTAFTYAASRSGAFLIAVPPRVSGAFNVIPTGTGSAGAPGVPGRRGEDAPRSPIIAGVPGIQGPVGATGAATQGAPGRRGEDATRNPLIPGGTGATGATGTAGAPGLGTPGRNGEDSPRNPIIPGTIGATGAQGTAGLGTPGRNGEDSPRNPLIPGAVGATGSQGIPGIGTPGRNGEDSPRNPLIPGTQGIQGLVGATGAAGQTTIGAPGRNGEDSPRNPFIPGSNGTPGTNGTNGTNGVTGPSGPPARNGEDSPRNPFIPGSQGIQGIQGITGSPGASIQGIPGMPGREGEEPRRPLLIPGTPGAAGSAGASGSTPPVAGIVLSGTNQSIEIVTTTGADIDFEASWNGLASSVTTPASNSGSIISATTTANVVPAPGASAQNTIVEVSITNVDTTFNQIVTVQKNTGGTTRVLLSSINLAPNERIEFTSDRGWRVFDQAGRERSQANGSIAVAIFTPGTVLGLPITNAASAPGQLLTGDQVGEIIRFSSQFHETGSGTVTYSLPDGFTGATFTPSAAIVLRGITAGTKSGKVLVLSMDRAATFTVTLNHEDGAATAANRFSLPGQANVVLSAGDTLFIWYDPTISRWTILSEQARSISFSGNDYLAGGFVANVLDLIVKDGTNTRVSSSNGGPSPPNGATLAVDHRWTSDNMCLREDFEYSFQSTQAINSGGTNITFSQSSWQLLTNANPGSFSNLGTTVADNPGVIRLTTGSISGDFIVMTKGVGGSASTPILFGNRIRAFEAILVSQSASSDCRIGFIDSVASNNPSNGVYFEFLGSTGVWRGRVVVSSVVYEVGSFTGGPSILTRLRCEIPSIGATPLFYANGTQLTIVTAGSAQAVASNGFCFGVGFFTRTNSLRNLDLDYIEYESQTLSR